MDMLLHGQVCASCNHGEEMDHAQEEEQDDIDTCDATSRCADIYNLNSRGRSRSLPHIRKVEMGVAPMLSTALCRMSHSV